MRVAAFLTHPTQYFSPLFRYIDEHSALDLTVYYYTDAGATVAFDPGFGTSYRWDTPVLEGYRHRVLTPGAALAHPAPRRVFTHLRDSFHENKFDALWLHGYGRSLQWAALAAAAATRTPLLLRGDSNVSAPRPAWRKALKEVPLRGLIKALRGCLYVGTRNRQYYERYGAREEQLFFTPFAVDNAFFRRSAAQIASRREETRQRFGIRDDAPVVLLPGKLTSVKAPLDLVRAFARVRASAPCHLLFAGDGPLRPAVERYAEAERLPDIHITGFLNQTEMPLAYTAADLQVLPSTYESWGLVVNEGMNFGLPQVVSDIVGCAPDLVSPGENGLVFPAGDVSALAEALARLVVDHDERAMMGRQSLEMIRDWDIPDAARGLETAVAACARPAG